MTSHTKTLVVNYQPTLHNIPKEQRPQLHCSRSLKPRRRVNNNLLRCSRVLYTITFKIPYIKKTELL